MGRLARGALVALVLLAPQASSAGVARADEPTTVDWRRTAPLSGTVVGDTVTVTAGGSGGSYPLVVLERPAVGAPGFVVTGRVRTEGVQGQGFLQLWTVFADGSRYFSRTLAERGPMAALSGTSGWREFSLPFQLRASDGVPSRLEIGVVLPGAGTVAVGPLRLSSPVTAGRSQAAADSGAWWSDRTAGIVGGVGGTLVGVLVAWLAALTARGRARRLVLGAMAGLAAAGLGLVVAGALAVASSQPFAVWFVLLLPGLLLVSIVGSRLPAARRAYAEAELRRIRAMDGA